jgi:hypothetical protein
MTMRVCEEGEGEEELTELRVRFPFLEVTGLTTSVWFYGRGKRKQIIEAALLWRVLWNQHKRFH